MALFGFDLSIVPDVDFAVKDASIIQSEVISQYEEYFYLLTQINKTLGRGDPVRLFLMSIIYQLTVQRSIVDSTGKNNLIKYAQGAYLDNIGARWGPTRGTRLPATSAATILQFSLATALAIDVVVAYGTLAQANNGVQFATIRELIIPAGSTVGTVEASAVQVGSMANGLVAGQVNQLVSPSNPYLSDVTNTVTTSGGSDRESDDRFRMRIWMAPESFSVAGPYGAYEYWAASANSAIIDVSVWSAPPIAGDVHVYFIMEGSRLPTQAEIDQVYAILSDDYIRPLTDHVFVDPPEMVMYTIDATFYIDEAKGIFAEDVRNAVYTAYEEYKLWQRSEIALDINPSKMIEMLMTAGAKRVTLVSPLLDDPANVINERQIAYETKSSFLFYGGLEDK